MRSKSPLIALPLLLACALASAQNATVTAERLNGRLVKFTTAAGPFGSAACVASIGPDGILLVDTGVEPAAPKLREALGGMPAVIINTHEHADHTGGNALLGPGAVIYAHAKVRGELTGGDNVLRELPEAALPSKPVTAPVTLVFNGETVKIIPVPGGHSDTDLVVHFTASKVLCLGGLGDPARFPYVDRQKGGSFGPYPGIVGELLKTLPADTVLVPGHGANADMAALKDFHAMLLRTSALVGQALAEGKDAKALQAKELFKEWAAYGQGFVTRDRWLQTLVAEYSGKPPAPRKSLMEPLYRALKAGGVNASVARYRELKSKEAEAYGFNEGVLNTFGYHLLLNKKRPADALVIFKLNVEEYPKAFNAYDSLGEAYLANGLRDLAIQSYQKAAELNPEFENAKTMLKKLEGEPAKPQ